MINSIKKHTTMSDLIQHIRFSRCHHPYYEEYSDNDEYITSHLKHDPYDFLLYKLVVLCFFILHNTFMIF